MKTISKSCQLALTAALIFIISNTTYAQGRHENATEHYKNQKPLILDVRFCSCQAIDIELDSVEPIPEFFSKASVVKVGVSENDQGFVSSGGLTFGYSINPGKEPGKFVFEYAEEYQDTNGSFSSQAAIVIDLDSWVTLSGYENKSDQGSEYFSVAVKLAASENR